MEKDPSIIQVIEFLQNELINFELNVVDFWDADLCAIGFYNKKRKDRLVYVSTYQRSTGLFYFDCEVSEDIWSSELPKVVDTGVDVSIEQLTKKKSETFYSLTRFEEFLMKRSPYTKMKCTTVSLGFK